jgi:uncharacterized membrane protein YqgA involved in biofilm formation
MKFFYFVILFVISCFLSIILYCANSATYVGEMLTLKELLNKIKSIIKGPIITQLFVSLFIFIYFVIFCVTPLKVTKAIHGLL